jgi:hypothetical protein
VELGCYGGAAAAGRVEESDMGEHAPGMGTGLEESGERCELYYKTLKLELVDDSDGDGDASGDASWGARGARFN